MILMVSSEVVFAQANWRFNGRSSGSREGGYEAVFVVPAEKILGWKGSTSYDRKVAE